jgi:LacI family transcriptional regulator
VTTIRDVAKRAGVSTATVSATLSGRAYVSAELRERVMQAVAALDYAPDPMARSLKGGVTRLLGLVIPDVTNPFYTELVHHLQDRARTEGHSVLLCVTDSDPEREHAALALLRSYRADGVILCPAAPADTYEAATFLPVGATIFVDSAPKSLPFDTVSIDNEEAGRIAGQHILSLGHRRIAVIAGPEHLLTGSARLAGFSEALAAQGVPMAPALVQRGAFTQEGGFAACTTLLQLQPPPTALFVGNNTMLIGVMRAIASAGLLCPDDISVVAVDDFDWAIAFRPRLTTIRQPVPEIADAAYQLLQRRLSARDAPPEHRIFSAELMRRDSCIALTGART